jgi:hypothetical protein
MNSAVNAELMSKYWVESYIYYTGMVSLADGVKKTRGPLGFELAYPALVQDNSSGTREIRHWSIMVTVLCFLRKGWTNGTFLSVGTFFRFCILRFRKKKTLKEFRLNLASDISIKNYYFSNETSFLKQFKLIFYKTTVQRDILCRVEFVRLISLLLSMRLRYTK